MSGIKREKMGKRKRLNRFITKWIKSDLPDDCSTVLLLGVTRIPTTPTPVRRPTSLALNTNHKPFTQTNNPSHHKIQKKSSISKCGLLRQNSLTKTHNESLKQLTIDNSISNNESSSSDDVTPSNDSSLTVTPGTTTMDRSVDSIGACSLDAEASVDMTDWSEQSSVGTLRSASLSTPEPQPHLPSYLSLACTVSGYSTTTNYDRDRLSKSRDTSPHRLNDDLSFYNAQNKSNCTYSVRNNLLSPPNLVPLPNFTTESPKIDDGMEKQILTRHEFYSSKTTKTASSFISTENRTKVYSRDAVDDCITDNKMQSKIVKTKTHMENGSCKTVLENSHVKEYSNGNIEQKSFIQQRVERLYGPGALAQGFFISKRQLNNSLDDSDSKINLKNEKLNKSSTNKLLDSESSSENSLKQSASSPTLPVMRHLRPEFRAQLLPIIGSPKKTCENGAFPKSSTTPGLSEKQNGHSQKENNHHDLEVKVNGSHAQETLVENSSVKDGHYFIKILENETRRLLIMAERIEGEIDTEGLSEEVVGKLRSAAGKARLLACQKMQQFKGLCTKNITQMPGEAFPTTSEDLQGFWDMVMLQVDQIDNLFAEIDKIRANSWKELKPDVVDKGVVKPRKLGTRPRPPSAGNEATRKKREQERKQMIEERRKAAREQKKQNNNIQIFVPESS